MATHSILRWVRCALGIQIVLLLTQFELGEWLTIFGDFPAVRLKGFSMDAFGYNVVATGPALIAHAGLGIVVLVLAVIIFLLSFFVRIRWLRVASGLAMLAAAGAGLSGFLFVTQGFAGDRSLFLMGTGFISVFVATCLSLYLVLTLAPRMGSPSEVSPVDPE